MSFKTIRLSYIYNRGGVPLEGRVNRFNFMSRFRKIVQPTDKDAQLAENRRISREGVAVFSDVATALHWSRTILIIDWLSSGTAWWWTAKA
jgi:hypothetical protein